MPPMGPEGAGQELRHRHISLRERPIENSTKGIQGVSLRGEGTPQLEHFALQSAISFEPAIPSG
jgi:hypothetical protein